jgi:hypothetical protein
MDPTRFDAILDGLIEGGVDWLNDRFSALQRFSAVLTARWRGSSKRSSTH